MANVLNTGVTQSESLEGEDVEIEEKIDENTHIETLSRFLRDTTDSLDGIFYVVVHKDTFF